MALPLTGVAKHALALLAVSGLHLLHLEVVLVEALGRSVRLLPT